MMTSKIVRADGTEIPKIKSVVFTEDVNAGRDLFPGCVSAGMIEVEVYGTQAEAPAQYEPVTYYRVDDDVETLIGVFYAEPSIQTKYTYKFTAYDAAAKLDTDYSARLAAIQGDFPLTVYDLVSDACSIAGVTLASQSWALSAQTVNAFYADHLTCRQIVAWAAEIACCFARCNTDGELIFDWYSQSSVNIAPGVEAGAIAYKTYGLKYENYNVRRVGSVAVRPLDTEGAAYIYPTSVSEVYATDDGGGNITLYNLSAVDTDGEVEVSGDIDAYDIAGNVDIEAISDNDNTLIISGNLLLMDAESATMEAVAQNIYTVMRALPVWRPATVNLFPFESHFRAGDIVNVRDIQGVSFKTLVMSHKLSQESDDIESRSDETYTYERTNTQGQLAQMSANIVQIEKLKVGWAQIDQAVIGSLQANGINADWIDAGALTIEDGNGHVLFSASEDDNTVEIAGLQSNYNSFYGTYSLTGNAGIRLQEGEGDSPTDALLELGPNVVSLSKGVLNDDFLPTGTISSLNQGLLLRALNGPMYLSIASGFAGDLVVVLENIGGLPTYRYPLTELDSKMPVVQLTGMTDNTIAELLSVMNANNSSIPLGPSVVYAGDSTVTRRAMVQCFKTNSTLGRGLIISPYAINGTYITLGANGWTT